MGSCTETCGPHMRGSNTDRRGINPVRNALVTGGAGFIGSHLSESLLARGYGVVALDNLSTGRRDNVAHLLAHPRFQLVVGSVLDEPLVDKFVERCDVVFHLAAAVGVQLIVKRPLESLETNIKGSEIVLQNAYRYGKKVLIASTSEIYGKNAAGPLREDDDRILGSPLKTRWSYSTAKATDEILAHAYWRQFELPTVIVRLFNVVGPRQTGEYGMVLPRFIDAALKGEDLTVYGSGKQTRCFAYVGDVARGLVSLVEEPVAVGEVFNIGSEEEISMLELAHRVIELTGSGSEVRLIPYDEAYEAGFEDMERRVPSIEKIRTRIGWAPTKALNQIIELVIEQQRDLATAEEPCLSKNSLVRA